MKKSVKWFLGLSTLITLGLYIIPFGSTISYPLLMLSTLVHEMGHGLTALAVGGRFDSFQMWSNGSGVAQIEYSLNNGQTINIYTKPFTVTSEEITKLKFKSQDIAGNEENPQEVEILWKQD